MKNINELKEKCFCAKKKVLEMCVNAGMGHVTTAFSCAEIMTVLYYDVMHIDSHNPEWSDRDRFIMSKNHGSVMLYPILADLGFIDETELMTFMKNGSRLGGHSKINVDGVDFSGGSLGIGLGVGCGIAYAQKLDKKDCLTFVVVGDGECYEGSIWESIMFAGHNKLNNLIVILDRNKLSCTDFTEKMLKEEPFADKWKAFNWDVDTVDGHSLEELQRVMGNLRNRNSEKPLCIIANTVKGHGIDFMENKPLMHGAAPHGDSVQKAFSELEKEML